MKRPKRLSWKKGPYTMDHVVKWFEARHKARTSKGCWPGWTKLYLAALIAKKKLEAAK